MGDTVACVVSNTVRVAIAIWSVSIAASCSPCSIWDIAAIIPDLHQMPVPPTYTDVKDDPVANILVESARLRKLFPIFLSALALYPLILRPSTSSK